MPLAQQLKADGFNVRLLVRNPEKSKKLIGEGYELIQGNVENDVSLCTALIGADGVHISLKGAH